MDGTQLLSLMTQRHTTLCELLELSRQQTAAIEAGHMSQLMQVLSRKQQPIARLTALAREIGEAARDDPAQRDWVCEADRHACRQKQRECEQMHVELLAMEAAGESALQNSRAALQQQISQLDASHQASQQYSTRQVESTAGARLDLSE